MTKKCNGLIVLYIETVVISNGNISTSNNRSELPY